MIKWPCKKLSLGKIKGKFWSVQAMSKTLISEECQICFVEFFEFTLSLVFPYFILKIEFVHSPTPQNYQRAVLDSNLLLTYLVIISFFKSIHHFHLCHSCFPIENKRLPTTQAKKGSKMLELSSFLNKNNLLGEFF